MEYAAPGSGYAAATAVNRLGWTTQVPVGDDICVVGRAPQPDTPRIRFVSRSNPRRLDLTWAEVTVLEGVQNFHLAESARFDEDAGQSHTGAAWDEAVEFMGDGWSAYRLGPGASIRTAAVLEAAASEPRKPEGFLDRLADLARRVPAPSHGTSTTTPPSATPRPAAATHEPETLRIDEHGHRETMPKPGPPMPAHGSPLSRTGPSPPRAPQPASPRAQAQQPPAGEGRCT